jgi:peptide/nickel transport system permease protein
LMAIALAIAMGIPLGILAALKRNSWIDYLANFTAMLGNVIPAYVLAVFLVILFSVTLHWLPTSGWGEIKHVFMPVFALSLGPMAAIARFTRVSLLDTLNQDYVRTAYAKGGTDSAVIRKHALRNSLIPITTIVGPSLASILGGSAVFVESQFRINGIGLLLVNAASQRDYPLAITATFMLALSTMILNLLVDIVYAVLDPRIKLE